LRTSAFACSWLAGWNPRRWEVSSSSSGNFTTAPAGSTAKYIASYFVLGEGLAACVCPEASEQPKQRQHRERGEDDELETRA